jgi:sugar (pentulose or hexulose) kinase
MTGTKTQTRAAAWIEAGEAFLGIEFGSTRIKAVMIGPDMKVLAAGSHNWENGYVDGVWTYALEDVITGMQDAYAKLKQESKLRYGVVPLKLSGIGVSAMMHGYLPFDKEGRQLAAFRTWRNTSTGEAAAKLSALFDFNIPQRWSVAHLYQAILNQEEHVRDIAFLTTLEGYAHLRLTGEKVLGAGEASGMFPLDQEGKGYDEEKLALFNALPECRALNLDLKAILPRMLKAGDIAGLLSKEGAALLDPQGDLEAGAPFCPPEGDAETGMVATNSIAARTGNVSAGTSVFLMAVMEKALSRPYPEIDIVATPDGLPVAMVHCNNCTTDLNAWVELFHQFLRAAKLPADKNTIYEAFFDQALQGDAACGDMLSIGYYSGEHTTGFEYGRPLLTWSDTADLSFSNLARSILFSSLATLRLGMDILRDEKIGMDRLLGHGGLYKTGEAGQRFTAAALDTSVSVMDTADEGGAFGIAVLAAYVKHREKTGETLAEFLDNKVFSQAAVKTMRPDPADTAGFEAYIKRFRKGLELEREAVRLFIDTEE